MLWPLICAERQVSPAPLAAAYTELVRRGLAQDWDRDRYLLHPAVARAGRDSDSDVMALTVGLLAALWENRYEQGLTGGQAEDALAHVAASAAPYLMRLHRWVHASTRCEEAINHDRSPSMAARLIPLLNELVRVQSDPRARRASRYVRAIVLLELKQQSGTEELEAVYADAGNDGDQRTQLAAASSMASALLERDPIQAAAWLDHAADAYNGDLSSIPIIKIKYAKIAAGLGDNATALAYAQTALADLDQEPESGAARFNVNSVRLEALTLAAAAAANLRDSATAARLRDEIDQEIVRQGAGDRAQAMAQFNRLTDNDHRRPLDDDLLIAARGEFSGPADQRDFAAVTMRLAKLDRRRGNDHEAVELARQALRSAYAANDLWTAADMHEDLAELLARLPQPPRDEIAVHLLASAVICLRAAGLLLALTPPQQLMRALALLSFLLARRPSDLPHSSDQLQQKLSESTGLDLEQLLHGTQRQPILVDPDRGGPVLPSLDDQPGDSVTDALTWASHWPPASELADPQSHPEHWQPIVDLFATASSTRDAEAALDRLRATGWIALAAALEPNGVTPDDDTLNRADRAVLALIRQVL